MKGKFASTTITTMEPCSTPELIALDSENSTNGNSNDCSSSEDNKNNNYNDNDNDNNSSVCSCPSFVMDGIKQKIAQHVVRNKLSKLRHVVIPRAIDPSYLDSLFPSLLKLFHPQTVMYNGGVANIKRWKISCYLEVMEGGIPCTEPNLKLLDLFAPLLQVCNDLFLEWYRQKSACNNKSSSSSSSSSWSVLRCKRLMTFITRYTPAPGEQALLKHVDGAGKVDGSVVVALPIDRWSAPEEENSFVGHGGGLTFWDGKDTTTRGPREIHYETRSGDLAFIDHAVWHQADPITKGTRWALVLFYSLH